MEQLLGMGFSRELASQALAATGGKSTLDATEWLLSRGAELDKMAASPPSSSTSSKPQLQARVDRFFWSSHPTQGSPCSSSIAQEDASRDGFPDTEKLEEAKTQVGSFDIDGLLTSQRASLKASELTSSACDVDDGIGTRKFQDGKLGQVNASPASPVEENRLCVSGPRIEQHAVTQGRATKGLAFGKLSTPFPPPSPSTDLNAKRKRAEEGGEQRLKQSSASSRRAIKAPLAERMRPLTVDEIVGQDHLLGPGNILHALLQNDTVPSVIFWGPPGTGKTSLARAISRAVSYRFVTASAVNSGVKEVREILEEAKRLKKIGQRTLFFMDEVHRFNKAQQDAFLPAIEAGHVVFIGATTENPSFEVNAALLSRCRVLTLNKLQPRNIKQILESAMSNMERGVMSSFLDDPFVKQVKAEDEALQFLAGAADGDARVALNALEVAATAAVSREREQCKSVFSGPVEETSEIEGAYATPSPSSGSAYVECLIKLDDVSKALQRSHLLYDKTGEEHYNLISALHKSMRGGDADAALYWLARMIEGGEGPLYIARRLIRFASEDVGLADPQALAQAVACYQACHFLGIPECNVHLGQCVAYLSLAPKSIAVYQAIEAAQQVVKETGQNEPVPLHLRNAPTRLMKQLGYGKGYVYPPSTEGPIEQEYLPPSLRGRRFLNWR